MKIQKAVLTETKHIAIGVLIGDAVMCGVFAALKKFDYTVPLGALLGVGAALVWGVYSVIVRRLGAMGYRTVPLTCRIFGYGLLLLLPVLLLLLLALLLLLPAL